MITIRPFKGLYYNVDKVADLSLATCPPYDVINKQEQDFYYQRSPYNFVRLILNRGDSQDDNLNNRHSKAANFFDEWIKIGALKQDTQRNFYFYKQDYFCEDKEFSRLGFIGLMQLNESSVVFPHENTQQAPKMDRLELIKKVKSNLSPIFTVFSDKKKLIRSIFDEEFSGKEPDFSLKDVMGVRSSIWRLSDKKKIQEISSKIKDCQIFIADGHHRYEVASMYLASMKKSDKNYSPDKGYNYLMTYFTPLESEGICIFPVHRLIKSDIDLSCLNGSFKISKVSSIADLGDKLDSFSKKSCVFGLLFQDEILLLELKDKKQIKSEVMKNRCFKDLDVAILDYYVLTELLKIDKDAIIYTRDMSQIKDFLSDNKVKAAFILRPTTVEQIKDVALCGERMPPKSTYFYPKLLSGLVVHKFE